MFDRRAGKTLTGTAESFGKVPGLYDMLGRPTTVDSLWTYEATLSPALDRLLDGSVIQDGSTWLTTLVPFVASLFARSVDFARNFEDRMAVAPFPPHPTASVQGDNHTAARAQEFQRMLAPVMTAQWTVVHFPENVELVTNDVGFSLTDVPERALVPTATPNAPVLSYVIPIDRRAALVLSPAGSRRILRLHQGVWVAHVNHQHFPAHEAAGLVRAIGAFAQHAVFGPGAAALGQAVSMIGSVRSPGAVLLEAADFDSECHIYDWFRVAALLRQSPRLGGGAITIDWTAVAQSGLWTGPLVVELQFPERTTGGVMIHPDRSVEVGLGWGRSVRSARRQMRDFRTGTCGLLDNEQLSQQERELAAITDLPAVPLSEIARAFRWPDFMNGKTDAEQVVARARELVIPESSVMMSGVDLQMFSDVRISDLSPANQVTHARLSAHSQRAVPPEWAEG